MDDRDDTAASMATDHGDGGGDGGGGAGATALASQDSLASYVSSDRPVGDDNALASAAAAVAEMAIDGGDAGGAVAGAARLDDGSGAHDGGTDAMNGEDGDGAAMVVSDVASSSAAPLEAASENGDDGADAMDEDGGGAATAASGAGSSSATSLEAASQDEAAAEVAIAPTHQHNMPGAAASVRGPRPSSTAASVAELAENAPCGRRRSHCSSVHKLKLYERAHWWPLKRKLIRVFFLFF